MNINELLGTIDRGLQDIQNEVLENLDAKAKAQRTKPVDTRLCELESLVARMKWEVSSVKSSVKIYEMRLESARNDASQALTEIRELAGAVARDKPHPKRRARL